jgi:amino-acid N-acetyltransferase
MRLEPNELFCIRIQIDLRCSQLNQEVRTLAMLRSATVYDVEAIQRIINSHAERGRMLFKSLAQLFEDLRDFAVFERESQVVGCCAMSIVWADLAEVRSLAVDASAQGQGVGRQLVQWSVDEARRLHIRRLFALTYEQTFFEKLGFEVVPKETLPLKVWTDCVRCPKRDGCDEIAMIRTMDDVPIVNLPAAPPTPRGVSIPVLDYAQED